MARPYPRLAGYISEMDVMAAGCQRNDETPSKAMQTARVQNEDVALIARYGTAMPSSDTAMNMLRRPSVSTMMPAGRFTTVLMNCRTASRNPIWLYVRPRSLGMKGSSRDSAAGLAGGLAASRPAAPNPACAG